MFDIDVAAVLGDAGALADHIDGFRPRQQQQEMAEAVARAIDENQTLICEAGTGTGKTFAYLVPAILSGKKVVISTGTKNLQDQLFHRDLPVVRKALAVPVGVALLKGRANYLCWYRLKLTESEGQLASREMVDQLQRIRRWAGSSHNGDIAEVKAVSEDAPIWPYVTSTTDNCLGNDCPDFKECHVMKARREAQEADIVVINHHLLCADMVLQHGGFGELLPGANAYIIDEAHQLLEVASNFFGQTLSSRQLSELARDTINEFHQTASDTKALQTVAERLEYAARDLRLAMGSQAQRMPWLAAQQDEKLCDQLAYLRRVFDELIPLLEEGAQRSKGLENCHERAVALFHKLCLFDGEASPDNIYWLEIFSRSFALNCTPLEIAEPFQQRMQQERAAWVFTSATLAVNGGFEHFADRLGLKAPMTGCWQSPFDYPNHALLYVPTDLPQPNHPDYTRKIVEAALPVLAASEGRAFMLFTSHRALKQAAEMLEGEIDYPLLVQGSLPRSELLQRFRELGNAVLLGTGSFWEGVDVRGEALSCVIIDKLPFATPDDPVLTARLDAIRNKGGNPFMDHQVPTAVISLKQGAGRLIRDVDDYGVMMLCDPRLIDKPYGRVFLDSLPPMRRTRKLELVQRFYNYVKQQQDPGLGGQEASAG